jgi:hypothetical protein
MNPYELGESIADKSITVNMINFEQEDDTACLLFAAKYLQEKCGYNYGDTIAHYENIQDGGAGCGNGFSDPFLTDAQEDVLLGFCSRVNQIQQLSEDGYVYHKVKDNNKPSGWDYVLETA